MPVFLLLVLICGGLCSDAVYAAEPGSETAGTGQLVKPGETPTGMDAAAWTKIQAQLRESALSFQQAEEGCFSARNGKLELAMNARLAGFEVCYRDLPGLNLHVVALEDATGRLPLQAVEPIRNGSKIEYKKGPVTEWYVNRENGVEQGFTITAAADGSKNVPEITTLLLGFGDDLTVQTTPAGDKAVFHQKATGRLAYNYEGLKAWDGRGRPVPARLECEIRNAECGIGEEKSEVSQKSKIRNQKSEINSLALVLNTTNASYPIHVDPMIYGAVTKLTAADGVANDRFGISVSVAGDVALVGAPFFIPSTTKSGAAYVFERNAGGPNAWGQVRKLTAADGAAGDQFGYSVSVAGDVALVGAPGARTNSGAAYVFERNAGGTNAWGQVQKLTAFDGEAGDWFGNSVSVAGDLALVGAYGEAFHSGAAYMMESHHARSIANVDFDGNGKADMAVLRPSTMTWYIFGSSIGQMQFVYGARGSDIPIPADYDGDGKADLAVLRPSTMTWYIYGSAMGSKQFVYGARGSDVPIPADYDGDGKADLAVLRPSTMAWYIFRSAMGPLQVVYGAQGDIPIPADYDGDGKADFAVVRPSTMTWLIFGSLMGPINPFVYGAPGDIPLK